MPAAPTLPEGAAEAEGEGVDGRRQQLCVTRPWGPRGHFAEEGCSWEAVRGAQEAAATALVHLWPGSAGEDRQRHSAV